jgi:ABC-2 type transport system permease protein
MLTLPSILGTWVAVGGYTGAAGALAVEREDGTLLRAKAVPQGMVGYLVGRIVSLSLITLSTLVIIFVAGCSSYWLGLGIRSGLLPDAAAQEISGSWRHLETAGVLGAWALAGLLIAPAVLRRMARRESGSTVEARRQRHLQRTP